MSTEGAVAHYYEANTRRFLRVGGSRDAYAIHRLLWGPDVSNARDASDYVHRLLIERIRALDLGPGATVVDLGCGVGGTLLRLAGEWPDIGLEGVTISREQARIGRGLVHRRGLADRCEIREGDFLTTRLGTEADVVIAIESFAHAASRAGATASAAAHLRPGGHLLLVDDFLTADEERLDARQRAFVRDVRAGWRLPGLGTVASWSAAAAVAGLELLEDENLTGLIRSDRWRDRILSLAGPALRRLGLVGIPIAGNMIGGNALQVGLREGFVAYRFLHFRRADPTALTKRKIR